MGDRITTLTAPGLGSLSVNLPEPPDGFQWGFFGGVLTVITIELLDSRYQSVGCMRNLHNAVWVIEDASGEIMVTGQFEAGHALIARNTGLPIVDRIKHALAAGAAELDSGGSLRGVGHIPRITTAYSAALADAGVRYVRIASGGAPSRAFPAAVVREVARIICLNL